MKTIKNMIVNKTIDLDLTKIDGNAFMLLGAFRKNAHREGWTNEEIEEVMTEAQKSDYNHLVATLSDHCKPSSDDDDDDDEDEDDGYWNE